MVTQAYLMVTQAYLKAVQAYLKAVQAYLMVTQAYLMVTQVPTVPQLEVQLQVPTVPQLEVQLQVPTVPQLEVQLVTQVPTVPRLEVQLVTQVQVQRLLAVLCHIRYLELWGDLQQLGSEPIEDPIQGQDGQYRRQRVRRWTPHNRPHQVIQLDCLANQPQTPQHGVNRLRVV